MRSILHHESTILAEAVKKLRGEIKDFDGIVPSRKLKRHAKRGLIDLGGKALKFLFGVADESDLKQVNSRIDKLWKGVTESIHLQDEQITYLNHTIVKMTKGSTCS